MLQQQNEAVRQTEVNQQLANLHNSIDNLKERVLTLCQRLQSVSTCKPVVAKVPEKNQLSFCPLAKEIYGAEDKVKIIHSIIDSQINDLEV